MNTKTKKKLCWNCEGNVAIIDETCPYCGVSLDVSPMLSNAVGSDALNPPYKYTKSTSETTIPLAPYRTEEQEGQNSTEEASPPPLGTVKATHELQKTAIALSSLLLGFTLLLFAAILLLFSDTNGYLTLRWSADYWYLYLVIGGPLLYWGWKTASSLDETEV